MRFILLAVLTTLWVVFINPFLPYWVVMLGIVILSSLVYPNGLGGFLGGGLGMGFAWLGQSIYIGLVTSSSLPDKLGQLMGMGSNLSLSIITVILGFILGAFSGLTGVVLRRLYAKTDHDIYRRPK